MQENYTYPMIIEQEASSLFNLRFPDFENAITYSENMEDCIKEAQDFLGLLIDDYESNKKTLPTPVSMKALQLNENQRLVYVNVWMPYQRSKIREVYVKKTLSIPSWLNQLAISRNLNFSSILVKALKKELHID